MSFRSVKQKSCSLRSVDQKCYSEVSLRSVNATVLFSEVSRSSMDQKCQKYGSAVLLKLSIRSANQKCGSNVAQKCRSKVLFRKVDQKKCRSEVLLRKVDQNKCGLEVLIKCRSKMSLRSVNQK